ncbi:hypothetical protein GCWU000324_00196 [Kingella oralis ATCC 51147]|uniref:Uncharacterized protein n=1 Tax=Kingella oralis ATCC 51147 TaxID=629741 RepID=C4GH63_9NEIS|nr:hypothetical protein GCWU000324_00196 [Kingella oralis ATCC 51147]
MMMGVFRLPNGEMMEYKNGRHFSIMRRVAFSGCLWGEAA